ncbi:MAG: mechanosensitive ion channel [Chitinophagaceae bacterium]|nr:mechanosensitive ion channel [Chitinophagaceae bacterium]MCA6471075.1 mechanosensitive ion channel [Chitinophagaceae bacterium]MCA6477332.1 mechanosensitive ion channel [Chitinophagaceae bacterium]MCA6482374.1 mechanosensitive ion channel [Chitinophagaceae bacterium]MCA6491576.1 mechanosensitive ion channel [Chitinophagaceae bacterium]
MRRLLQHTILSNTVSDYLWVLLVCLVTLLLIRFISSFLAKSAYRFLSKNLQYDARQSFLNLVLKPLDYFLFSVVVFISLAKLNFPAALDINIYQTSTRDMAKTVFVAWLIITFIWLCRRGVDFIALILEEKASRTSDLSDNQLIIFFKDFFKVILLLIGILLILRFSFNKEIGSILTGLSIVGAAIALAARESMENLIASFIIFFDKPFITGEQVKVAQFTGTIEKIGLRSTRIRTPERTLITVPNKQMVDNIIDNLTQRNQRRTEIRFELDLSATTAQLAEFTSSLPPYIQSKGIELCNMYVTDTGKNAHVILVEYFSSSEEPIAVYNKVKEDILLLLLEELQKRGIQLAAASNRLSVQLSHESNS